MAAGVRRQAAAAMAACLVTLLAAHGAAARALQADAAALEPAALPNAVLIGRSTVGNSVQNCLADTGVKGVAKDAADNRTSYDPSRQQMVTRYDRARFVYNKVVNRYPMAVVYPANVSEVQQVIRCARKFGINAVPRSGGHAYDGVSVQDDSIGVDMSASFTAVEPTAADPTVFRVGSGVRLGPLYYALWQQGQRAVPGGVCPTVGAGGHILGGGYGYWSRLHGFVCDNLVGVEMVDTSGALITANRTYNSDLLWASCGGGGNNLGIVTTYILQTFSASAPVTAFTMAFPGTSTLDVLRLWQKWAPYADERYTSSVLVRKPASGSVQVTGQFAGSWAEAQKGLKESGLLDVPGQQFQTNGEMSWPSAALLWAQSTMGVSTSSYANLALPADVTAQMRPDPSFKEKSHFAFEPLSEEGLSALYDQVQKAGDIVGAAGGWVQISAYGGAISRLAPNATAFPHRSARLNLQYNVALDKAGERQAALAWQRQTVSRMVPYASNASYINYLDVSYGPNAQAAYYGGNYGKLMQVKRKYDVANAFNGPLTFDLDQAIRK